MNTKLSVSVESGKRVFITGKNEPFFWLGDTAWACPARAAWEDWVTYIDTRAGQGFNVIQINSLPQFDAVKPVWKERKPFALGTDEQWDYDKINIDYFHHLDKMITYANEKGLIVAVVVLWFVHVPNSRLDLQHAKHCTGRMTLDQAKKYAEFLVDLLKNREIVWIISGDDDYKGEGVKEFYNAVGKVIKEKDQYGHLITTHPAYMSGEYFHEEDWLDFNMIQSSHGDATQHNAYELVQEEWKRLPPKPVINAEPCYEGSKGWDTGHIFDRRDVRKACWWSILSGSIAGITYGASGIWQWAEVAKESEDLENKLKKTWYEAIEYPGAIDLVRIKTFLTELPWWTLEPAQQLILNKPKSYTAVGASKSGDLLIAYLPEGEEIKLDISKISLGVNAHWYWYWWKAENGEKYEAKISDGQSIIIKAPSNDDWIFVLRAK